MEPYIGQAYCEDCEWAEGEEPIRSDKCPECGRPLCVRTQCVICRKVIIDNDDGYSCEACGASVHEDCAKFCQYGYPYCNDCYLGGLAEGSIVKRE